MHSTVTPGKFPTRCRIPVSALNSVLFPLFGFPMSATRSAAGAGGGGDFLARRALLAVGTRPGVAR
jgi:hypothetical protein